MATHTHQPLHLLRPRLLSTLALVIRPISTSRIPPLSLLFADGDTRGEAYAFLLFGRMRPVDLVVGFDGGVGGVWD